MSDTKRYLKNTMFDLYFLIDPRRFHLLKFILEGYDNLAVLSSFKGKEGVVRVRVAPQSLHDLMILMSEISGLIKRQTL